MTTSGVRFVGHDLRGVTLVNRRVAPCLGASPPVAARQGARSSSMAPTSFRWRRSALARKYSTSTTTRPAQPGCSRAPRATSKANAATAPTAPPPAKAPQRHRSARACRDRRRRRRRCWSGRGCCGRRYGDRCHQQRHWSSFKRCGSDRSGERFREPRNRCT